MRITVILVGRMRERYLREGAAEYAKRLGAYARVEVKELQDEAVPESYSEAQLASARETEAGRIMRALRADDYVVALHSGGVSMSSLELSRWVEERALGGDSNLVFVIGGTTGLAPSILRRARLCLSMGSMTFPHQFMPMLVLEQLYRASKITRGEPYHR